MNFPKNKAELYDKYYLKAELVAFCKQFGLPTTGSKPNLLEYLAAFIENKPIEVAKKRKVANRNFKPELDKIIDENYSNNEIHRAFFKEIIGKKFKFNVQFCNWMMENKGQKTYQDAFEIYNKILQDKKLGKETIIGKQFEYNQYTIDFFKYNPKLSREDCIKCWNYKKQQIGSHKYEKEDLNWLD
jgi:thiamine kinase-like enzyme